MLAHLASFPAGTERACPAVLAQHAAASLTHTPTEGIAPSEGVTSYTLWAERCCHLKAAATTPATARPRRVQPCYA